MTGEHARTRAGAARLGPGTRELLTEVLAALDGPQGEANAVSVAGALRALDAGSGAATDTDCSVIASMIRDHCRLTAPVVLPEGCARP